MKDYKKYICRIFIFVIFIIMLFYSKSYGAKVTLKDGDLDLFYIIITEPGHTYNPEDVFKDMKKWYNYDGPQNKVINVETKITVKKVKADIWNVKVGTKWKKKEPAGLSSRAEYSTEQLKSIFGYEEGMKLYDKNNKEITQLENNAYWNVTIVAEEVQDNSMVYRYRANELYSGNDIEEETENSSENEESAQGYVDTTTYTKIKEFLKHAVESSVTAFLNGIIHIGDAFQTLANMVQTGMDNLDVVYSPSKFSDSDKKNDKSNLNSYVNYSNGASTNGQYDIYIKAKDESGESHGFTPETKIPVISTDIYTLATNKVDFIKSNFFVKDNSEGKIWITIRDFIAAVIHGVMYIIVAVLLLSMIWHGTGMVKCSIIGSVSEKKKHITALHKLEFGFIMLVSTIFIEAICLFLSDSVFDDVNVKQGKNKYEGPIRVTVQTEVRSEETKVQKEDIQNGESEGYDVSSYQPNDIFDYIENSGGAQFVILRIGITRDSGKLEEDTKFEHFYEVAKSKNIPIGVYWYTKATTYSKGVAEANKVMEILGDKKLDFPIYIDVEDDNIRGKRTGVTAAVKGFCKTIEDNNYLPGIYCSDGNYNSFMIFSEIKQYELWVARFPDNSGKETKPTYVTEYGMWQTGEDAKVTKNGKTEKIDSDIAYKDYPAYIKSSGLNGGGTGATISGTSSSSGSGYVSTMPGELKGTVEGNEEYSFSTTPTGYLRYMANIGNIYLYSKRALYVIAYIGLAFANLIATVAMIIRMVLMMFLAVIGFVIIIKYVLKSQNASTKGYFAWVKMYAGLASVQVILAIMARILLEVIFKP